MVAGPPQGRGQGQAVTKGIQQASSREGRTHLDLAGARSQPGFWSLGLLGLLRLPRTGMGKATLPLCPSLSLCKQENQGNIYLTSKAKGTQASGQEENGRRRSGRNVFFFMVLSWC